MAQAQLVLAQLKKNHVTHVIGLPDNSSVRLIELLREDPEIRFIPVTREGEAFAIASGLWIGGKIPVVLVQNTGFFESGDGFRGTVTRMRIPLVCLITFRGYPKLIKHRDENGGTAPLPDAETLSLAGLDSAAVITEATLAAWGLPYGFLHDDNDVAAISRAFREVEERQGPFALLVSCDLT